MKLVLQEQPEINIPFLFEMWNWVGDKTILPTKWYELLKKHDKQTHSHAFSAYTREYLISTYVRDPKFDPNGFFFLTTRSEAVAGVLVWPINEETCELVALAALPSHRDRETTQCIIALGLCYAFARGFTEVLYNGAE